jgi:formylglycine-generating enzyme required for sulfatase activity/tRNA A-37 threonylcarbamoyl transferase component Bud32
MGVVYAAVQHKLERTVALKVLSPALAAQPQFLKRFRTEAAVAGRLASAHLLPVYDVLEVPAGPVLVLPLIEGTDLGRVVRDRQALRRGEDVPDPHPWASLGPRGYLDRVLPLLDQAVSAVTALHRGRVLHRDIKPSNALVDDHGHLWLSDFGLARFEGDGSGTAPGVVVGTAAYISPQQARGQGLDARDDVFSLAGLIYQVLTLELPYGKDGVLRRSGPPVAPSRHQPLLTPDFDAVLLRALERDRADRYASAAAFEADWRRVRQGQLSRARLLGPVGRLARAARRGGTTAALLALVLVLGALGTLTNVVRRSGPGTAREAPGRVPPVPVATSPVPAVPVRTVDVLTDPPGARVVLVPLHRETGAPDPSRAVRPAGKTPLRADAVPAGEYLVVAAVKGWGFHEVFRIVPLPEEKGRGLINYAHTRWELLPDGGVRLPLITVPRTEDVTHGMAHFQGGAFTMGDGPPTSLTPKHTQLVAPFFLDVIEVTVGEYRQRRQPPPEVVDHGLADECAVRYTSFDMAVDYAEAVGKRLPDEAEFEFAATAGGTRPFPWPEADRQIKEWPFGRVREPAFDRLDTRPPVYGLYSNVAEWTTSHPFPYPGSDPRDVSGYRVTRVGAMFENAYVVRGAPWSVIRGEPSPREFDRGPRGRLSLHRDDRLPGLGFRCARSDAPRFLDP